MLAETQKLTRNKQSQSLKIAIVIDFLYFHGSYMPKLLITLRMMLNYCKNII